jgi:hypothetical protein
MKIFNQKNNFESEIVEAGLKSLLGKGDDLATLRTKRPEAAKAIDDIVAASTSGLGKPITTRNGTKITTSDELAIAIRDLTLTPKELGRVEKGFLKSASTDGDLRRVIATKFAKDKSVLDELAKGNYNTVKDIKKYLDSKYYHKSSIDEIIKQMKTNGAIDAKGLLVKNASKVANTGGAAGKSGKTLWTRATELVNNIKIKKMSWKQLLAWGIPIGVGGAALWYYIKQYSDVIPDGMPTVAPIDDWGPCLNDLISSKQAKIERTASGQIYAFVGPNEKYPKGLQFYSNRRVMNTDTKEMGSWTCTAGQVQTNENMNKSKLNESIGQIVKRVLNERYVMEQSASQIDSDVEDMIDYLDVPVWGNDYKNIAGLLKKYASNGKFNEFKEVYEESGFMKTSLRSDISSIYAIDASSVRAKKELLTLLDQIESGKVIPSAAPIENKPNQQQQKLPRKVNIIGEQSGESDLKITWDKDKKSGGGGTGGGGTGGGGTSGGGTTRRTYYDCSGVNIETTPLTYGCKNKKIGEIQGCLGLTVDNKFGPNTRRELKNKGHDITNGITKAIYDKVKANCGQTASTQAYGSNSLDAKNYMKPINLDLGPVPQMPEKNTTASGTSESEGMTDNQYYNSLIKQGFLNPTNFLGMRRMAYNGPRLDTLDFEKLNRALDEMEYYKTTVKATDLGARYVWQQK